MENALAWIGPSLIEYLNQNLSHLVKEASLKIADIVYERIYKKFIEPELNHVRNRIKEIYINKIKPGLSQNVCEVLDQIISDSEKDVWQNLNNRLRIEYDKIRINAEKTLNLQHIIKKTNERKNIKTNPIFSDYPNVMSVNSLKRCPVIVVLEGVSMNEVRFDYILSKVAAYYKNAAITKNAEFDIIICLYSESLKKYCVYQKFIPLSNYTERVAFGVYGDESSFSDLKTLYSKIKVFYKKNHIATSKKNIAVFLYITGGSHALQRANDTETFCILNHFKFLRANLEKGAYSVGNAPIKGDGILDIEIDVARKLICVLYSHIGNDVSGITSEQFKYVLASGKSLSIPSKPEMEIPKGYIVDSCVSSNSHQYRDVLSLDFQITFDDINKWIHWDTFKSVYRRANDANHSVLGYIKINDYELSECDYKNTLGYEVEEYENQNDGMSDDGACAKRKMLMKCFKCRNAAEADMVLSDIEKYIAPMGTQGFFNKIYDKKLVETHDGRWIVMVFFQYFNRDEWESLHEFIRRVNDNYISQDDNPSSSIIQRCSILYQCAHQYKEVFGKSKKIGLIKGRLDRENVYISKQIQSISNGIEQIPPQYLRIGGLCTVSSKSENHAENMDRHITNLLSYCLTASDETISLKRLPCAPLLREYFYNMCRLGGDEHISFSQYEYNGFFLMCDKNHNLMCCGRNGSNYDISELTRWNVSFNYSCGRGEYGRCISNRFTPNGGFATVKFYVTNQGIKVYSDDKNDNHEVYLISQDQQYDLKGAGDLEDESAGVDIRRQMIMEGCEIEFIKKTSFLKREKKHKIKIEKVNNH